MVGAYLLLSFNSEIITNIEYRPRMVRTLSLRAASLNPRLGRGYEDRQRVNDMSLSRYVHASSSRALYDGITTALPTPNKVVFRICLGMTSGRGNMSLLVLKLGEEP